MSVPELIRQYLSWCERHRTVATTRKYRTILLRLGTCLGGRKFLDLTPLMVDEWLHTVDFRNDGQPKSNATRSANATAFMRLQNWAIEQKLIDKKVVDRLEKPRSLPRESLSTEEEIDQILAIATPAFRLIYQSLLRSGARPGELAGATIGDYDRDKGRVVLEHHKTARTGHARKILVSDKLAALIEQSLSGRMPDQLTPGSPLFLNDHGERWTSRALTNTWARLRRKAGINPRVRLYDARHRFGTLVTSKYGIARAADLMGHRDISTTKRYDHPDEDELRDIQNSI